MITNVDTIDILKETSRTFFIPISRLPEKLKEAIANAYLCMRAIDEIEDHQLINAETKVVILTSLEKLLSRQVANGKDRSFKVSLKKIFHPYATILPEVSLRLDNWLTAIHAEIAPRVWDATLALVSGMKYWAGKHWHLENKTDLDEYTFCVAGAVGLLICDIWEWFDGSSINRDSAVQFGRGLQAVNILRNRQEDLTRGVDFFPSGWNSKDMYEYARKNLNLAHKGVKDMPGNSFKYFVEIPLRLAEATLEALEAGKEKLSREQVLEIIGNA